MTYFDDLSEYTYFGRYSRPGTRNVGWLDAAHAFPQEVPSEKTLDLLWNFCPVSVARARGIHCCELCEPPRTAYVARNGQHFLLGTHEIRVFSDSVIYAAPSLIYHYVRTHHYKPPDEFLSAIRNNLQPPAPDYFARLHELGLEWNNTSGSVPQTVGFRFEKIDGKVQRIEVPLPIHVDEN